jgi:hypothetical protein
MRVPKGLPQVVYELPGQVVPGLVVLVAAELASGGTLWPALLARVSGGLLDPDNVWAFALGVGVVLAMGLHAPLAAIGEGIGAGIDRLRSCRTVEDDYEWLCVRAPEAADVAEESRNQYKVANALVAAFLAATAIFASVRDARTAGVCTLVAAGMAWPGSNAKSAFLAKARRLRDVVGATPRLPE